MDEPASIYENTSSAKGVSISLKNAPKNTFSVGAQLVLSCANEKQFFSLYPTRGFQSSRGNLAHFAIPCTTDIRLEIYWPDGLKSSLNLNDSLSYLELDYAQLEKVKSAFPYQEIKAVSVQEFYPQLTQHKENSYDDYLMERLIPQKMSALGPCIAAADLNGDGLEDIFIGSARNQASKTMIQQRDGSFKPINSSLWTDYRSFVF
jgi:hypothetical protein